MFTMADTSCWLGSGMEKMEHEMVREERVVNTRFDALGHNA